MCVVGWAAMLGVRAGLSSAGARISVAPRVLSIMERDTFPNTPTRQARTQRLIGDVCAASVGPEHIVVAAEVHPRPGHRRGDAYGDRVSTLRSMPGLTFPL
jgi:hypothetical protein